MSQENTGSVQRENDDQIMEMLIDEVFDFEKFINEINERKPLIRVRKSWKKIQRKMKND